MKSRSRIQRIGLAGLVMLPASFLGGGCDQVVPPPVGGGATLATPSRSTTIALTSDDRIAVVANKQGNSVSILQVQDQSGDDRVQLLAEVAVGDEPGFVAIHPNDNEAYVTNAVSGTVSVIARSGNTFSVVSTIAVPAEPRGCAITPNGTRLYVAHQTAGIVTAIDVATRTILGFVTVGGNPSALAITNDGDEDDTDEQVFVTQFYAELIPGGPGEVFDEGKRGVVRVFSVGNPGSPQQINIAPFANVGFTADRTLFCQQFNPDAANNLFCPDENETDATSTTITADPQGAYPNQFWSALIRGNRLYLPNIGACPEPPVRFNVNVQALVNVVNTSTRTEESDRRVNLNAQVKDEVQPENPAGSLVRLFGNDLVAIDANHAGTNYLIVSRGGNYVFKAGLNSAGQLNLGAPNVIRFQTGNLPTGVVISAEGGRAYVNNEVNESVTIIDLHNDTVLARDVSIGTPPSPGTPDHEFVVGKLAFFTALGLPDSGIFNTAVRDLVPLNDRNKASDNGWSGCGSCHPDGLADGVTWSFGTGPRQTVPLDGFFANNDPNNQRISNYSAVMGSITDFNNNARGVQGGIGFAGDPPNPGIFAHGLTRGASDALDAMTIWAQGLRSPVMPPSSDTQSLSAARTLFDTRCSSCHGGVKWTKSQVIYDNNPTFDVDPGAGGVAFDPGVMNTGPQLVSFTSNDLTIRFLDGVGTFDATDPLELRGAGAQSGRAALGAAGFNAPSLLGIGYHAPYLHNGAAQTLPEVFLLHGLDEGTIATELSTSDRNALELFLNTIDDRTQPFGSETDDFLSATGG
ncbi:MAG: hypothetical protein AABZ47_03945 [Planctomycetota bacterium]